MKYNKKANNYQFYTCQILLGRLTINEGFTYLNDARERNKEVHTEAGKEAGLNLKVYSFKYLVSIGITPNDNKNWKDLIY
jgi:hypothetical protein